MPRRCSRPLESKLSTAVRARCGRPSSDFVREMSHPPNAPLSAAPLRRNLSHRHPRAKLSRVADPAEGWAEAEAQPGDAILAVLRRMGAECVLEPDGSLVLHGHGRVHGVDVDLGDLPELVTTVVALAALADSPTAVRGIAHLRGHETDRLAALAAELSGLGGDVTEHPDGLEVRPRPLHAGVFHTYADHRMATMAAILALRIKGLRVADPDTTAKTMPDFVARWEAMLG